MAKALRGICAGCGREKSLPAKGKCDKCYRTEYYERHPEAKAARDANQKKRSAARYAEHGDEMRARMRENYWKTKAEGGERKRSKPQTRRKVLTVGKKDAEKAVDVLYNESNKLCALCHRKARRGDIMPWGEDLDVVHKVCGWAKEARDRIERRERASVEADQSGD